MVLSICLINLQTKEIKPIRTPLEEKEEIVEEDLYGEISTFIKKHEGFREKPYYDKGDSTGFKTIGYGFITIYLKPKFRNMVTREQADSILNKKLKRCFNYSKKTYLNLNRNQQLAIAHLGYAKGFDRIQKHKLHKMFLNGQVEDSVWIYFSKAEVNSKDYRNNRLFELNLFKKIRKKFLN